MTFSITTLSIMNLFLTLSINDTKQRQSVLRANMQSVVMLSVAIVYCYAECRYTECRGYISIPTLSIMAFSIMINKTWPSAYWHFAYWQKVVILSIVYAECHLCRVSHVSPLCWESLCWMSLCWGSWRHYRVLLMGVEHDSWRFQI